MNDEMGTGDRARPGKATPKPHQCDIRATPKRVDSQPIGTPKPPQGSAKATLKPPQCDPNATSKPYQSHRKWSRRRKSASCRLTPAEPRAWIGVSRRIEMGPLSLAPHPLN